MPNSNPMRRAFTLIELLVVIAIIAILAAILFPVFAQAKAAGKKTACLAHQRQIGIALMMYREECDGLNFTFFHGTDPSRANPSAPLGANRENRWWNQIQPYAKNLAMLASPSDPKPTPSPLEDGQAGRPLVPRSYVANRAVEALPESAVDRSSEIVLVTIKDSAYDDSWFEPPKNLYPKGPGQAAVLALGLQSEGVNMTYFDGHAKWRSRGSSLSEPCGEPWSGVSIMRLLPIPTTPGRPERTPWHPNCPN